MPKLRNVHHTIEFSLIFIPNEFSEMKKKLETFIIKIQHI